MAKIADELLPCLDPIGFEIVRLEEYLFAVRAKLDQPWLADLHRVLLEAEAAEIVLNLDALYAAKHGRYLARNN